MSIVFMFGPFIETFGALADGVQDQMRNWLYVTTDVIRRFHFHHSKQPRIFRRQPNPFVRDQLQTRIQRGRTVSQDGFACPKKTWRLAD